VDDLELLWIASALGLALAPLFIRRVRVLLLYVVLVGGAIAYLCIDYYIDTSQSSYDGSPGDAFAAATLWIWTTAFVVGLVLRAAEYLCRFAIARWRAHG
jgi:hypothetical protein